MPHSAHACTPLDQLPSFHAMAEHVSRLKKASLKDLFAQDNARYETFSESGAGLHLDYSKQLLDSDALQFLFTLAREASLEDKAAALLQGEPLNNTEGRPALHTLLRAETDCGEAEKFQAISETRARMQTIVNHLHSGEHQGYTGKPISDVVNIGIGGSDLGPRLVTQALAPFHGNVRCHYVANVDPSDINSALAELDPQTTLFIVCSKSFRTEETLANSLTAREWLMAAGATETDLSKHFLAVTTNLEAAEAFGILPNNCLPLWDWVGGRYSVWSAVGLSSAIAVGWDNFSQFLAGAAAMDAHFSSAELENNLPVIMALLEIWYCNGFDATNHVVLPYEHHLRHFPDFLQQLTMESNGKQVTAAGQPLKGNSGSVLWGSAGTMGQHSFHQLLHQGTLLCPADFILPLTTQTENTEQHQKLVANCLAQSRALMVGRTRQESEKSLLDRGMVASDAEEIAPHLVMPGNRPSSTISMEALNPKTLGALLALYEHRTFCSSQLWGINPFDQWGVELGKEIGTDILNRMQAKQAQMAMDASTENLLAAYKKANRG
ncbi:MAG: glucose-6-phosphate isomerase [Halioglobus sp.]